MTNRARLLPALVLAALSGLASAQEGDPERGSFKATPCMGCHGIPGYFNVYPTYHVPKVGGQYAEYIVLALQAYKAGDRQHPTMQAQASALSEQDMLDIAAFFASFAEEGN